MSELLTDFTYIEENLKEVRARLAAAAARAGRPVPQLIAVTKSATDEEVSALLRFGVDAIAENRPQLFTARRGILTALREEGHALSTEIHLIGNLQTNKIKYVIGEAALIQSLDTLRLAEELEKQAERRGIVASVLVEVNSGREAQKGGLMPEEVTAFCEALRGLPHLSPLGLMTMGPDCETPEDYRPYFALTRTLAEALAADGLLPPSPILSMGMSDSYEVAAEEGATHVRVGRTLFKKPTETA